MRKFLNLKNTGLIYAILVLIIFTPQILKGQEIITYRKYATQNYNTKLTNGRGSEILGHTTKLLEEKFSESEFVDYNIPIVFHIVGDIPYSDIDILQQLSQLNMDFSSNLYSKTHESNTLSMGNLQTKIQFFIPEIRVEENNVVGILRYPNLNNKMLVGNTEIFEQARLTYMVSTDCYLNVWIVSFENGVSGYAQFPGNNAENDGIVIDFKFLKTTNTSNQFSKGRTLTHLVGNYLGLFDLWNDDMPCIDDYVYDTPIHNSENYGNPGLGHVTLCSENQIEAYENFMDNTVDSVQSMFTYGQAIRMQNILSDTMLRNQITLIGRGIDCLSALNQRSDYSLSSYNNPVDFNVSPNPSNGQVNIIFNSTITSYDFMVYSLNGKKVETINLQKTSSGLNFELEENGVYYLLLIHPNGVNSKIVVVLK